MFAISSRSSVRYTLVVLTQSRYDRRGNLAHRPPGRPAGEHGCQAERTALKNRCSVRSFPSRHSEPDRVRGVRLPPCCLRPWVRVWSPRSRLPFRPMEPLAARSMPSAGSCSYPGYVRRSSAFVHCSISLLCSFESKKTTMPADSHATSVRAARLPDCRREYRIQSSPPVTLRCASCTNM